MCLGKYCENVIKYELFTPTLQEICRKYLYGDWEYAEELLVKEYNVQNDEYYDFNYIIAMD